MSTPRQRTTGGPTSDSRPSGRMHWRTCPCASVPAAVTASLFRGASGVEECHLAIEPTETGSIESQLDWVSEAYEKTLVALGLPPDGAVLRRLFCSDLHNQAAALRARAFSNPAEPDQPCAISWVGQSPAPPARVALWAYHIADPTGLLNKHPWGAATPPALSRGAAVSPALLSSFPGPAVSPALPSSRGAAVSPALSSSSPGAAVPPAPLSPPAPLPAAQAGQMPTPQPHNGLTLQRGELTHHWVAGLARAGESSFAQTREVFEAYAAMLAAEGLTVADHVLRTWVFVRDIDMHYQAMVAARRNFFEQHGLTTHTHYLASSGIEAQHADPAALVTLDAWAVAGLRPEQVHYLCAPEHLSPTHVYGVTFERGTAVDYADRRQVIISGTASIDAAGQILHVGNAARQLERTLENIAALLAKAGASFADVASFIVYVRDSSDYDLARRQMQARFPDAPIVVVRAPVCRPGWLIEIECLASVPARNPQLPAF